VNRYLYRVQYTHEDDSTVYESVCVRAASEAEAQADVETGTDRYKDAVKATRTLTLIAVTADA
jgi:hypothetical protein